MLIAHLADTHIRNLKYHKEYQVVFDRLYQILREKEVDYIVHCGDIAHTKTQISPEFVQMCSDFFKSLADIAPTYIIPGNHDGNLRNSSRLDALSPIVAALAHKDLHLLKDSVEVNLKGGIALNVLSVFDRENWSKPSDPTATNIALYHGAISNSKTDLGWIMEHGEDELSIFQDFDYALLGDIHKTNQILDHDGKVRYPGSTVQQNHGETNDKGFLLWDITGKDTFTCEHISIPNPKPFVTIDLTAKGRLPKKSAPPEGARIRLVSSTNLPLDVVRKAVEASHSRFKPESVTYLNKFKGNSTDSDLAESLKVSDLRDIEVQEGLISEYLSGHELEDQTLDLIYSMNKSYSSTVEQEEEVSRNVNWNLKKFNWSNLFNYGEDNEINFENTNGIIGILGKNYSGKSSIVDSLLYTLYNSTSKNNRKNLNVINQNKDDCVGDLQIDVGQYTYHINRRSEKYTKKLRGETTQEAKTDLDFVRVDALTGEKKSLNGLSRSDTDKNIRKIFGTLDDFLLTSMSSQLDSLSFIGEGSTKRKEILAKFLDLELFEKKYKLAKEKASDLRANIKRLGNHNFTSDAKEARKELALAEIISDRKKAACAEFQIEIESKTESLNELINAIESIPTEIIDIKQVLDQLEKLEEIFVKINDDNTYLAQQLSEDKETLKKIENFINQFDIEDLREKINLSEEKSRQLEEFESEMGKLETHLNNQNQKISSLSEVPCGTEYTHCKFIKDAHSAKKTSGETVMSIEKLSLGKKSLEEEINEHPIDKLAEHMEKYDKVLDKKNEVEMRISSTNLSLEKNKTKLINIEREIESFGEKEQEYQKNKDVIDNLESLLMHRSQIQNMLEETRVAHETCQNELMELYKTHGSLEEKIASLASDQTEYESLQDEYSSVDLYMKCMHGNGISYDIIKRKLPIVNEEVSKVLANIVDFEVFFENDGRKLDILIKHPKHEPRPIEMGSGAEKTIASMAIRLALLNVSTLPKGDTFILDEPGTSLDEENMEGFIRILDMIKSQFKTVILISHLDSLKDCVDQQIIIDKDNYGYANVKY
ncbi:MAG TPA: hypothetical protein EYN08_02045 [Gammaproteobacteria bacterium]|nr:hypothetical protein [Gammaproteobacteria bacterium]